MFTGIIESIGRIRKARMRDGAAAFTIQSDFKNLKKGESVAVEGVCLTVVGKSRGGFDVEAGEETLRKSTLAWLQEGSRVNLERAMKLSDRLGGHIVQGHVDGRGRILSIEPQAGSKLYYFSYPGNLRPFIVEKGSIAVCGVSLTVSGITDDSFSVSLLPYTVAQTTFKEKKVNDPINLEADVIAKIIAKQAGIYRSTAQDRDELYQKMELPWPKNVKEGKQ